MNYCYIKDNDIANGSGVRVSLFVSGCNHHCKGCFNPETWDFNAGEPFTEETLNKLIGLLSRTYIRGLTLIGGEPLDEKNVEVVLKIIEAVKRGYHSKTLWCYSGYTYEELLQKSDFWCIHNVYTKILKNIDVLVDGEFKQELKNPSLRFRGSSNQRIINMKDSIKAGSIVLWDDQWGGQ